MANIVGGLPEAIVLEDDLFFSVRIEKMLQRLNYRTVVCDKAEEAIEYLSAGTVTLVVMNYGSTAQRPDEVAAHAKRINNPAVVLAYVSHGEIPALRAKSRAAGCDLLVANSVIVMRLPQLVERLRARADRGQTLQELEDELTEE